MKILICGNNRTGKSWLASRLHNLTGAAYYDEYNLRQLAFDWDWSEAGRQRLADRMRLLANYEVENNRPVICSFTAHSDIIRTSFGADYTIWMNTESRDSVSPLLEYDDPGVDNFVAPTNADEEITTWMEEDYVKLTWGPALRASLGLEEFHDHDFDGVRDHAMGHM